jgi:hypothetical protein
MRTCTCRSWNQESQAMKKFSEAEIKQLHGIGTNAPGKLRQGLHAKGLSLADEKMWILKSI